MKWDQGLVRKYGSTNHYRLLNQLRNEVKAYPLKKKLKSDINQYETNDIKKKRKEQPLPNFNNNLTNYKNNKNIDTLIPDNKNNNSVNEHNFFNNLDNKNNKIFNNTQNISYSNNNSSSSEKKIMLREEAKSDSIKYQNQDNLTEVPPLDVSQNAKDEIVNTSDVEQPVEVPVTFMERLNQIEMR